MRALIDADLLVYACAFGAQETVVGEDGEKIIIPRSWESCQKSVDFQVSIIEEEIGSDQSPLLFLTNSLYINKHLNKQRRWKDEPIISFSPNFREEIAKSKGYKENRVQEKPYHYYNVITYLLTEYDVIINEDGLEADDAMCIYQTGSEEGTTMICSRDKDVRQCGGWHYSWEHSTQPSIGPYFVEQPGWIELQRGVTKSGNKTTKLFGYGNKFFYAQMLMGDAVDTVKGAKGKGPVAAYNLLKDATTERECYEIVKQVYVDTVKENWKVALKEQAELLWMVREINRYGKPIMWRPPSAE